MSKREAVLEKALLNARKWVEQHPSPDATAMLTAIDKALTKRPTADDTQRLVCEALAAHPQGLTWQELATVTGLGRTTIVRWTKRPTNRRYVHVKGFRPATGGSFPAIWAAGPGPQVAAPKPKPKRPPPQVPTRPKKVRSHPLMAMYGPHCPTFPGT